MFLHLNHLLSHEKKRPVSLDIGRFNILYFGFVQKQEKLK